MRPQLPASVPVTNVNELNTLVENRKAFTLKHCELNIYETHRQASDVALRFTDFTFTSMLRGKKLLKLEGREKFDYLPGESVITMPGEVMNIDFPEADTETPTQCIALSIDASIIGETLSMLNERYPKAESGEEWHISDQHFYLLNNSGLVAATNNILRLAMDNNTAKDLMAGMALRELIIRLMQTQARQLFETGYKKLTGTHRFAHIIDYIKNNLHEKIMVETLSKKACMSTPNFFRCFKQELGISPVAFILQERIKAAKLLLREVHSVSEAAYRAGFNNVNYFIRVFKAMEGITPKTFRQNIAF